MTELSIGVQIEPLAADIREAIRLAAKMGANGIEINAVCGVLSLENMSQSARREYVSFVRKNSLQRRSSQTFMKKPNAGLNICRRISVIRRESG